MRNFLERFYELYPHSEIQDYVKLAYQMSYGVTHFFTNSEDSLHFLKLETSQMEPHSDKFLYECLNDNLVRVNLRPYLAHHLDLEELNANFYQTSLLEMPKLSYFLDLAKESKSFLLNHGFKEAEFDEFMKDYKDRDYPPVHHTKTYTECYHPAYRLISRDRLSPQIKSLKIMDFLESFKKGPMTVIAFDGKCASGKSSVAQLLANELGATIIPADDFMDGSDAEIGINSKRLINDVLTKLQPEKPLSYGRYDCSTKKMETIKIPKVGNWVILEGAYSANSAIRKYLNLIAYFGISDAEQTARLKKRSPENFEDFQNKWIPRENRYLEKEQIVLHADIWI
ncbi:MAG TPA: hypothetical protein DD618_04215 [Acholeplasmatales bacterium]|nr:hypothetical protein [Acholeplasmatales bacterium]